MLASPAVAPPPARPPQAVPSCKPEPEEKENTGQGLTNTRAGLRRAVRATGAAPPACAHSMAYHRPHIACFSGIDAGAFSIQSSYVMPFAGALGGQKYETGREGEGDMAEGLVSMPLASASTRQRMDTKTQGCGGSARPSLCSLVLMLAGISGSHIAAALSQPVCCPYCGCSPGPCCQACGHQPRVGSSCTCTRDARVSPRQGQGREA